MSQNKQNTHPNTNPSTVDQSFGLSQINMHPADRHLRDMRETMTVGHVVLDKEAAIQPWQSQSESAPKETHIKNGPPTVPR